MQTNNTPNRTAGTRRYDLDWLRVIAIFLLLYFHSGMMFVEWKWHINNVETSKLLEVFMSFLSAWRMPLLFVISGVGTAFAFKHRTPLMYMWERTKRLLIPLTAGIFIVVAPQVYIERISQYESYIQFYPHFFEGVYPAGNFSWHHLWFVAYLFTYSLVSIPVFLMMKKYKRSKLFEKFYQTVTKRNLIGMAVIPIILSQFVLRPYFPENTYSLIDDWAHYVYYLLFFIFGYMINLDERTWRSLLQSRRMNISIAFICTFVMFGYKYFILPNSIFEIPHLYSILRMTLSWYFVISLLGYSQTTLNFNSKFLKHANEGIYPFYILHQTVIMFFGYFVLPWDLSLFSKFIIISTFSLFGSILIYLVYIKPFNFMRVLFGMRTINYKNSPCPINVTGKFGSSGIWFNIFQRKIVTNSLLTIFLLVSILSAVTFAQEVPEVSKTDSGFTSNTTFLPVLGYSPETRYIAGAAVLYMYRTAGNIDNRPSVIVPVFLYSQNKQVVAELNYEIYFNNDKYFLQAETEYAKFPLTYYGTGLDVDEHAAEDYTPVAKRMLFNFKNRVNSNLYLGLKLSYKDIDITETEEGGRLSGNTVIGANGGKESGIGFTMDWDSRNSISYTTEGRLFSGGYTVYSDKFGGDYNVKALGLSYREFHTIDSGVTFSYNVIYGALFGAVPFDMLASIGGENVLRGVFGGKYNDKQSFVVQGEIKKSITDKIGLAVFAGTGTIGETFNDMTGNKFLTAYGFGLRYKLVPEENLNLRFDFGFSQEGMKFYITLGEAF